MKKRYQTPELEIVQLYLQDVILGSETLGGDDIHDGTSSSSMVEFDDDFGL